MARPAFGDCESITVRSRIVLEESRCKITLLNTSCARIRKVVVDKCLLPQMTACDFLVIDPHDREYFIELKGSDTEKGVAQLEASIRTISADAKRHPKSAYIVFSGKNPIASTRVQILAIRFAEEFNAILRMRRSGKEEPIGA